MAPRQGICQESSSVRQNKDSGYTANSIAAWYHTFQRTEVNLPLSARQGGKYGASGGWRASPPSAPRAVSWAQCGGKSETRRSGSGRARSDTRGHEKNGTPNSTCPFRARSKCAARPGCRTFRNARTRHIRWERPRRKNASRRLGNARGAASSLRPDNLSHCSDGTGVDCRYDRPDKAIFSPLVNLQKG
jgi:hypothetical protein